VQETKTQYIIEIGLCLDTQLNVMACPKYHKPHQQALVHTDRQAMVYTEQQRGDRHRCADTEPIAYTIIRHN